MKILLMRPFTDASQGQTPPLALMYLSAYLKAQHIAVGLRDRCLDWQSFGHFAPQNRSLRVLLQDIQDEQPDLLGMTLFSREIAVMTQLCRQIKQAFPRLQIVLGGPHPTAMPQQTLELIPACDIVARGEGETILADLVASLDAQHGLAQVNGISFRDPAGQIVHNAAAAILRDLDRLPFPDKTSLLQNYQRGTYSHLLYGSPTDIIMTSRGCPFQCAFCFKVCSAYRSRSPANVLQEIDWIVQHIAPEYIQIMDDSFTIQRERCVAILDELIARQYPCKLKVRSRVNAVDAEILRKMKQAQVTTIVYGLESGSQTMLDAFQKKTTVAQNIAACQLTRQHGINCFGDLIVFYPGETRATLRETEQFLERANPHAVKFYALTPLPNTQVYAAAQRSGCLVGDWDGSAATPWVKLAEFQDAAEMQRIAKRMFFKQFLKPARLCWLIGFYGASCAKRPWFFLKMLFNTILKKTKY